MFSPNQRPGRWKGVHHGYILPEAIDDNHDALFRFTRYFQGVETDVFKVGAKMSSEFETPGYRSEGTGKWPCICLSRELWDASQRARRKDQRIFRSVGGRLGGDVLVQKIQPQGPASGKIIPDLRIKFRGQNRMGSKMDGEDSIGIAMNQW